MDRAAAPRAIHDQIAARKVSNAIDRLFAATSGIVTDLGDRIAQQAGRLLRPRRQRRTGSVRVLELAHRRDRCAGSSPKLPVRPILGLGRIDQVDRLIDRTGAGSARRARRHRAGWPQVCVGRRRIGQEAPGSIHPVAADEPPSPARRQRQPRPPAIRPGRSGRRPAGTASPPDRRRDPPTRTQQRQRRRSPSPAAPYRPQPA